MPFTDIQELKSEIVTLWESGKYSSIADLTRHIIAEHGDFGREQDSLRRSVSKMIAKHEIPQNKDIKQFIPKILLLDIETAPLQGYIWSLWKQNIGLNQIISEWFMLCWSAKWIYSDEVFSGKLNKKELLNQNDRRICGDLWRLLDEAELVVAHNGDRFDIPKINTRFIMNGLNRPSPYRTIDTLTVARKQFGFSSNRLDALAGYFGFEHKLSTDFTLWDRCVKGDTEAMDYMSEYCERDVLLLEEVYLKIRNWIPNHPNIGLYFDTTEHICPNCGSTDLIEGKPYYTTVGRYQTFRCKCGAISRVKKSDYDNSKLLRSV